MSARVAGPAGDAGDKPRNGTGAPPMPPADGAAPAASADPAGATPVSSHVPIISHAAGDVVQPSGIFEQRRGSDRRARPTPMWSRYMLWGGRRRHVRRTEEREGAFVDAHGSRLFAMVLVILVLNLLDAWFTLLFLSHGGKEMNPMVQAVLDFADHPWPFLLLKTLGIGLLCGYLTVAKNFRCARIGLWLVAIGYAVLLGWHFYLLSWLGVGA